jgi:uncharacterized protein (DUF305 family)
MTRTTSTRMILAAATVVMGLGVAACGSSDDGSAGDAQAKSSMPGMHTTASAQPSITPGPSAGGAHNAADTDFATAMISHHGQAIQMADMILAKTQNADVKSLAERIKAAQAPEIATMSGWLQGWDAAVPDPFASDTMSSMHSDHMMSAGDMQAMASASGTEADRMFLEMMPKHHEGAIAMARDEVSSGMNSTAKALAQKIIVDQTAEIAEMSDMLTKLS